MIHTIRDLLTEMDFGRRRLLLSVGNRDANATRAEIDNLDEIVKQLKTVRDQTPDEFVKTTSTGEPYVKEE